MYDDVLYNFKKIKNVFIYFLHIFHLIIEKYLKFLMRKSFVFVEVMNLFNDLKFALLKLILFKYCLTLTL